MNRRQMMIVTAAMASHAVRGAFAQGESLPAFDPRQFGAKGDGRALDSQAINAAIEKCSRGGGGTVHLRSGVYRSGTIVLKSNVTLYLEEGSTILGSLDLNDYNAPGLPRNGGNPRHLILAMDEERVTLAGPGRIDGQGRNFWEPSGRAPLPREDEWADVVAHEWKPKGSGRPSPLLEFVNCRGLRIEGVHIENAPGWTLRPYSCDNVTINGITIKNPVFGPNTDGIDITCSQNVTISNCTIDTGDDAICLKTETPYGGQPRTVKNVKVTNCTLTTCCNGFKIGTGSEGGFENISFTDSVVYSNDVELKDRVIAGIALEVVDGGWIDGVMVSGIKMQRARTAIFIRLGNRKRPYDYPQHGLRNVTIQNVQASGALLASSIVGIQGDEVRNVTLSGVHVENILPSRGEWVGRAVPEKDNGYPEARMFGMLPASGLYARHVRGLQLNDVAFSAPAGEARPAVIFDDVIGARVSGLASTPVSGSMPVVQLINSSDIQIAKSTAPGGTDAFLRVEGSACDNIVLSGDDLHGARKAFEVGGGASPTAVTVNE